MRRFLAGVLGLALLAPAWADDKKSDTSDPPKTPKDQVADLGQAYEKEMRDLIQQFRAAESAEEKASDLADRIRGAFADRLDGLSRYAGDLEALRDVLAAGQVDLFTPADGIGRDGRRHGGAG